MKKGKSYQGHTLDLLLDLLKLNIPSLMAVEINQLGEPVKEDQDAIEKSQHMIQSFVCVKYLRGLMLLNMGDIMVRLHTYIHT